MSKKYKIFSKELNRMIKADPGVVQPRNSKLTFKVSFKNIFFTQKFRAPHLTLYGFTYFFFVSLWSFSISI